MRAQRMSQALLVLLFLGALGCAHTTRPSDESMQPLAAHLLRLTKAVEFTAHYDPAATTLQDGALLDRATQADPTLLAPFRAYTLRVRQQDGHADLLVCTRDGRTALLEDVGCTEGLDRPAWTEGAPCDFSVNVPAVCGGK